LGCRWPVICNSVSYLKKLELKEKKEEKILRPEMEIIPFIHFYPLGGNPPFPLIGFKIKLSSAK
jgi:hypothetical protein